MIDWCLMPTIAIFQLYCGVIKFYILDTWKTLRNKRYLSRGLISIWNKKKRDFSFIKMFAIVTHKISNIWIHCTNSLQNDAETDPLWEWTSPIRKQLGCSPCHCVSPSSSIVSIVAEGCKTDVACFKVIL